MTAKIFAVAQNIRKIAEKITKKTLVTTAK